MNGELILDGKKFVSSKRGSQLTGYAKDYIGQLARGGKIEARLVGRSWYVSEDSLFAHKNGEPQSNTENSAVNSQKVEEVQKDENVSKPVSTIKESLNDDEREKLFSSLQITYGAKGNSGASSNRASLEQDDFEYNVPLQTSKDERTTIGSAKEDVAVKDTKELNSTIEADPRKSSSEREGSRIPALLGSGALALAAVAVVLATALESITIYSPDGLEGKLLLSASAGAGNTIDAIMALIK